MLIFTTWRTFLTYVLDYMTQDEVMSAAYFIITDAIRYDLNIYASRMPIETAKVLWASADEYVKDQEKYYEYLCEVASQPRAAVGKIIGASLSLPTIMLVPECNTSTITVHTMQKYFYQEYGVGSMWFDGLVYDNNPNIYKQDNAKAMKTFKQSHKKSQQLDITAEMGRGVAFRERRLSKLNQMSESSMRHVLKKYYDVDTVGLSADAVFGMMLDLYVNEEDKSGNDEQGVKAVRHRYKELRRKGKRKKRG